MPAEDRPVAVRLTFLANGDGVRCYPCRFRCSRNPASGYECGLFQAPLTIRDGYTVRLQACLDAEKEARDGH